MCCNFSGLLAGDVKESRNGVAFRRFLIRNQELPLTKKEDKPLRFWANEVEAKNLYLHFGHEILIFALPVGTLSLVPSTGHSIISEASKAFVRGASFEISWQSFAIFRVVSRSVSAALIDDSRY